MAVVKYSKLFPASAVSHVDLLRVFLRILKRAKVKVNYTNGYNPHMKIYFSPPIPAGVESVAEYVTIDTPDTDDFLARFNAACPKGIVAEKFFDMEKNPNLAAVVDKAEYIVKCPLADKIRVDGVANNADFEITFFDKNNQPTTKKVGGMVFVAERVDDETLRFVLSCGNNNLRAERLVRHLCDEAGVDYSLCEIKKTEAFVCDKTIDEFLRELI